MNGLAAALWVEALKARRSRLPWITAAGFSLAPLMGGLFMLVLKDPAWARRLGLISAKAQITGGSADWPTYVDLIAQAVAVGGLIIFGLIATWEFGREFADGTLTDVLALPTSRTTIAVAKSVVTACWAMLLTAIVSTLGLVIGMLVGLPGWSGTVAVDAVSEVVMVAVLTVALVMPFGWAASAGRGYLPAIGAIFLALFLSQVIAALGWGAYFPWSVPALSSGVAGPQGEDLHAGSYVIVVVTGIIGIAGTIASWRFADHS